MKIFKWVGPLLLIVTVLLLVSYIKAGWWFHASEAELKAWYPSYGSIVFWFRNLGIPLLGLCIFCIYFHIFLYVCRFALIGVKSALGLAVVYLLASLTVGEQHPFTTVPMYNYLPNEAYVFFVRDSNHQLVPLKELTSDNPGAGANFSHLYYNTASYENRAERDWCVTFDKVVARKAFFKLVDTGNLNYARHLHVCRSCLNASYALFDRIQCVNAE